MSNGWWLCLSCCRSAGKLQGSGCHCQRSAVAAVVQLPQAVGRPCDTGLVCTSEQKMCDQAGSLYATCVHTGLVPQRASLCVRQTLAV
jgi:hypothetical protein